MRALKIAATGMSAQQMRVETISNNLANMSTTGYNARRAEFADLHYQQMTRAGTVNAADGTVLPTGVQLGLGVRPAAVSVHLQQGSLSATGGDLDFAIEGDGYLEVTLPSGGAAYTRDGALKRTGEGLIVTSDGFPVAPEPPLPSPPLSLPSPSPSWTRKGGSPTPGRSRTPPGAPPLGRPHLPPCSFIYGGRGAPHDTQVDLRIVP